MTDSLRADLEELLEEYRATATPPAPFTQERALVERLEGLLARPA